MLSACGPPIASMTLTQEDNFGQGNIRYAAKSMFVSWKKVWNYKDGNLQ